MTTSGQTPGVELSLGRISLSAKRGRRFSSYRIGNRLIDRMEKPELLAAVGCFAADAPVELLRNFLKDIADASAES